MSAPIAELWRSFQRALSFFLRICATLRSSGFYPASAGILRFCPALALGLHRPARCGLPIVGCLYPMLADSVSTRSAGRSRFLCVGTLLERIGGNGPHSQSSLIYPRQALSRFASCYPRMPGSFPGVSSVAFGAVKCPPWDTSQRGVGGPAMGSAKDAVPNPRPDSNWQLRQIAAVLFPY